MINNEFKKHCFLIVNHRIVIDLECKQVKRHCYLYKYNVFLLSYAAFVSTQSNITWIVDDIIVRIS